MYLILFECIFVGIYSSIVYFIIHKNININLYFILFLTGFIKHLFGYFLNIQSLYCNYGYACKNIKNIKNIKIFKAFTNNKLLLFYSLIEGILFLFLGLVFIFLTKKIYKHVNNLYVIFTIGVVLHISSEILGTHKLYCENNCILLTDKI